MYSLKAIMCYYCRKDAKDCVKCQICKLQVAHSVCILEAGSPAAADTAADAGTTNVGWTCPDCRLKASARRNKPGTPTTEPSPGSPVALPKDLLLLQNCLIAAMDEREERQNARWDGLEKRLYDLENAIKFVGDKYENLAKEFIAQKAQTTELKKGMESLSIKVKEKDQEIRGLQLRVNTIEQEALANNLELHGLEFQQGDDVRAKVREFATSIGAPADGADEIYRVVVPRQGGGRPVVDKVVVRCKTKTAKGAWMSAWRGSQQRQRRVQEAPSAARDGAPAAGGAAGAAAAQPPNFAAAAAAARPRQGGQGRRPVRVYDELTPFFRKLLFLTRGAASQHQWKFVWVKDGKILARKSDTQSPIVRISCEQDIVQKMGVNVDTSRISHT